jgi:hypothetical protein
MRCAPLSGLFTKSRPLTEGTTSFHTPLQPRRKRAGLYSVLSSSRLLLLAGHWHVGSQATTLGEATSWTESRRLLDPLWTAPHVVGAETPAPYSVLTGHASCLADGSSRRHTGFYHFTDMASSPIGAVCSPAIRTATARSRRLFREMREMRNSKRRRARQSPFQVLCRGS